MQHVIDLELFKKEVICGNYETFQVFLTNEYFKKNNIQDYFELAVYHNQIKKFDDLTLKFKKEMRICISENKQNILHIAAINGQKEICEIILKHFPETLSLKNENQKTAFDLVCQYGHNELYEIFLKFIKIPFSSKTPLHIASEDISCSSMIKNNPKWTTMKDLTGSTPLHLAASNGHIEIVKLLLH